MAGSPASMREYLDEYVESGANYYVCSFQWGSITSDEARSPWVLCLGGVHSNEADPLFVFQDEGVTVYNPSNSAELWLAFSKWVDCGGVEGQDKDKPK